MEVELLRSSSIKNYTFVPFRFYPVARTGEPTLSLAPMAKALTKAFCKGKGAECSRFADCSWESQTELV